MSILESRADRGAVNQRSAGRNRRHLIASIVCATCIVSLAEDAWAQCAARDVLQNEMKAHKPRPSYALQQLKSARDVPTWKTIRVGTFGNSVALRNVLDAMRCGVGGTAAEILARPTFTVASKAAEVKLVVVRVAELGFKTDTVTLAAIYARAMQIGFKLADAEVGPQLRIQYLDQPMGEFLTIGMKPIKTWGGEPTILNVANGGAGLILIGQDGRDEAESAATSRFVFARSNEPVPNNELEKAAALPPPWTERHSGPQGNW